MSSGVAHSRSGGAGDPVPLADADGLEVTAGLEVIEGRAKCGQAATTTTFPDVAALPPRPDKSEK